MSGDVIPMPDRLTEPWEVHEHPGCSLDEGAILCACVTCEAAIYAQAERTPRMPMGLATGSDRLVVTAEYLAEVMAVDRTVAPLLYVSDDYVRRLFVPVDSWWFFRSRRWWSLTCHEDEEAAGRRHPRHRIAKRQSEANRLRHTHSVDAVSPEQPPASVRFTPLATAVEPWRRRHRQMLAELRAWALERGRPVDPDLVALILAAREAGPDDEPLGQWTRTGINRCLSVDTFNWCSLGRVLYPDGVPVAFWLFLDFLAETGRLERASDPLDELRKPLICYGGLDRSGRERTGDDNDDDRSSLRCECYVRYRGPTHGELADLASAGARLLSHVHPLAE